MDLKGKNDIVNKVRDFLMNEGLSRDEAIDAILDAEVIHLIGWDDGHDGIRPVEEYVAEAYEFWKAKQN